MEKNVSVKLFQERCQEWIRVTDFELHTIPFLL